MKKQETKQEIETMDKHFKQRRKMMNLCRRLGFYEGVLSEMKNTILWIFYFWLIGLALGITIAIIILGVLK